MDFFVDMLHDLITSPWAYLVIFAFAAFDALIPIVPSETAVITAGVFAATGNPDVFLVILSAGGGAMAGDQVSYRIGRASGPALERLLPAGSKREAAFHRARGTLFRHGGVALVVARYIPGGRTAVTLATGAIGYSPWRFLGFDALACFSWAIYATLVGYLGGEAFEDNPLAALGVGLGIVLAVSGVVELIRRWRHHRRAGNARSEKHVEPAVRR
jgi:membrane-associated protein